MKTTTVQTAERGRSPLGAHIRFLMDGPHGNVIHSTVPPGMVGHACRFRTIDEYWFVLSGEGELWRRAPDGRESVTRLVPGVCIDIALGTAFQYRCTGAAPLVFTCTAMPPWPGDDEASIIDGPWTPHVAPDHGDQRSSDQGAVMTGDGADESTEEEPRAVAVSSTDAPASGSTSAWTGSR